MNPTESSLKGILILAMVFGGIAMICIIAVKAFRLYVRRMGTEKVMAEGAILGESGIEFPRMFFLGVGKLDYTEIASAALVSFPRTLTFRAGYKNALHYSSPNWLGYFEDKILIETKPSQLFRYMTFGPKNPELFYQGLKERMGQIDHTQFFKREVRPAEHQKAKY